MGTKSQTHRLKGLSIPSGVVEASAPRKYLKGLKSDDYVVFKNQKPVFALDYLSLKGTDFCFNSNNLSQKDYVKLLGGLKRISAHTYETLNKERMFHFHSLNWKEVQLKESEFNKCVGCQSGEIEAFQVKVFEEARVIGFIYQGVFYLVMFDFQHKAYPRK
ncbi:MAG: hypothetical protein LIO90_08910 [Bacteroidales bacterium]|nr:hypothetical protein [Bacteroidales bacterium]